MANVLVNLAFLATLAFAWVVGGRAERWGAGLLAMAAALTWGLQLTVGNAVPAYLLLDFALVVGLGVLFARYKLMWIGVAGVAQTLLLAFSATRLIEFPLSETSYVLMLNASSIVVFASLGVGAWARRWGPKDPYADLLRNEAPFVTPPQKGPA